MHPPAVAVQHMPVNGLRALAHNDRCLQDTVDAARAAWSAFAAASPQLSVTGIVCSACKKTPESLLTLARAEAGICPSTGTVVN